MSKVITREASELGWDPGCRAMVVQIDGVIYLHHHTTKDNDGDVMYDEYRDGDNIVRVFND